MKINSDAIRQLAELLDETGLSEIEVVDGEKAIRVNKGGTVIHSAAGGMPQQIHMAPDPAAPQVANTAAPSAAVTESTPGAVTSPMVGTVYMAAEPGAPDFISKGAKVSEGDTLLIIEAMKVMNPIKAPKGGTVTQIIVQNEQPVEYGEVLLVIE
ncbi:MAG: acetyl-CoA carboxylase biotin carboxyl carrier protein [Pseudobdellovibrionaceae bacterium]